MSAAPADASTGSDRHASPLRSSPAGPAEEGPIASTSASVSSALPAKAPLPVVVEPVPDTARVARPPLAARISATSMRDLRGLLGPLPSPGLSSPSVRSALLPETPSSAGLPSYLDQTSALSSRRTASSTHPPLWLGTASAPISSFEPKQKVAFVHSEESLKRDYDDISLFGLTMANLGFIQGGIFGAVASPAFGGSSMLSVGWPVTAVFFCGMAAILAELASAYPVAGAMMTWTFRLARAIPALRSTARFFSWVVGSFLLCAHVLTQTLISYQLGSVILGVVRLYNSTYVPAKGAVAGVSLGVLGLSCAISCSKFSRSPWLWRGVLLIIFVCFMMLVIALGTQKRHPLESAEGVFLDYSNETGFSDPGIVYLVGWVQTCLAIGQDAAVHMAEETKNPSRAAPRAIFWGTLVSYALGWVIICIILAAIGGQGGVSAGTLPHTSLFAPGYLLRSYLSEGLATAIIVLLLLTMFAQNVSQVLASSRYCWALARDNALPFSSLIRRVSHKDRIPRIAVLFLGACTVPAILLVGFIRSVVTTVALQGAGFTILTVYLVPIVLYICAGPEALDYDGRRQFSLRKASIPVACISALVVALSIVVLCFPTGYPVTIYSFSWSPVIFFGVTLLSCLSWIFYGNLHYAGPIKAVLGPDVELPRFSQLRSQATPYAGQGTPAVIVGDAKPSHVSSAVGEPGMTKVFLASGAQRTTMRGRHTRTSMSGWTTTNGVTTTEWEDDLSVVNDGDEDEENEVEGN